MRVRRRHPLSLKEVRSLRESLSRVLSDPQLDALLSGYVETASCEKYELVLSDKEPVIFTPDGIAFPTLRGFLRVGVQRRYLTVDMGAVPFVVNGANVMAPGVVGSDPALLKGDLCVVTEQRHGKPLCIARMTMDAAGIDPSKKGKVADNIHHVGDSLWKLAVE